MFARKTVTEADKMAYGAPPQLPWHVRALAEAEKVVSDLQIQLEEANRAMRVFRSEHMIVVAGRLAFRCASIDARAELDQRWYHLVMRRDSLLKDFTAALQDYAKLKTELSHTN